MTSIFKIVLLLCAATSLATAQVIQITGGDSTQLGGAGGQAILYFPTNTAMVSGGIIDGHAGGAISDTFKYGGWNVTVGDKSFFAGIDGLGGAGFQSRGLFLERNGLGVFVGATGASYITPYLFTATNQHATAGLAYHHNWNHWTIATVQALSGGTHTSAGSVAYASGTLHLTAAGGLLAGKPLAGATFNYSPVQALHINAAHENLFYGGQQATVDSVGLFGTVGPVQTFASLYTGTSSGKTVSGVNVGTSFHVGPLTNQVAWYSSAGHAMLLDTGTVTSRHWALSATAAHSNSGTNFNAGGAYHNNRISISVNHGVGFEPFSQKGFVQTSSVTLTLKIHDANVNLAANQVAGQVRYSAYASTYAKGPYTGSEQAATGHVYRPHGRYVLQGSVTTTSGQPVSGAAVRLGRAVVYSTDDGLFSCRTNAKVIDVEVLPAEFAVGNWRVVTAPSSATPAQEIKIVVENGDTK